MRKMLLGLVLCGLTLGVLVGTPAPAPAGVRIGVAIGVPVAGETQVQWVLKLAA